MKQAVAKLFSALLLILTFSGCNIIAPGFSDYDVTGYIHAVLSSSYLQDHASYIEFTKKDEAYAAENNAATVENGAIYFCNTYGLYPNEEQMVKIKELMADTYRLAKFTVKEKVKTDAGYDVEVSVEPLTIFQNCTAEFENALNGIKNGTLHVGGTGSTVTPKTENETSDPADENLEEDDLLNEDEQSSGEESSVDAVNALDENALFIDEVIRICREKLNGTPTYGSTASVTMNILQSKEGDLSLDMNQIEQIDKTVLLLPAAASAGDTSVSQASSG